MDFTGGGEGGGEEEEQVLAVKDDYVGVTSIDAQATRTGPGPEGPGTRPEAKPGSKVGGGGEPCTAFNWRRRGGGEEAESLNGGERRQIILRGPPPFHLQSPKVFYPPYCQL